MTDRIDLYMADREAIATFARAAWASSESGRDFATVIRTFVDDIAKAATAEDDRRFITCLKDRLLVIEIDGKLRVTSVVKAAVLDLIDEVNAGHWPTLKFGYEEVA